MTAYELQPFTDRVQARRAKNPINPTWVLLDRRWEALTGHAGLTLAPYSTGVAAVSHERQTAEILVALLDSVDGVAVIDTALAMFAFSAQRPSRFKSDKAFGFQLSRRVRGLADASNVSKRSPTTGRMKRTYAEVPPRVMDCLAESLKVAFGVAGLRLAELEKKDEAGVQAERNQLSDALKDMT